MNNAIVIQDLCKGFRDKSVLKDLSLVIPQGSVFGLLGRNGAGKTTLIKCVLGLIKPQSGKVEVLGDDPWDFLEETKERIGYVPQTDRPYPWLTVRQIIDYTASFYRHWNHGLTDRLMREWELASSDKIGLLSEGQAQKLNIILALGHEPGLLVFDEPVASLDPTSRRQFLKTVLEIVSDRPCTIFFSTHITSDLERVADRVAVLKDGRVPFAGELDVLKEEIKRLRIRASGVRLEDFKGEGILHREVFAHEAILAVRGFTPEIKQAIEQKFKAQVDVEDLNLEEIFLELNR